MGLVIIATGYPTTIVLKTQQLVDNFQFFISIAINLCIVSITRFQLGAGGPGFLGKLNPYLVLLKLILKQEVGPRELAFSTACLSA